MSYQEGSHVHMPPCFLVSKIDNHTMHKLSTIDECANARVNLPGMTVHPLYTNLSLMNIVI